MDDLKKVLTLSPQEEEETVDEDEGAEAPRDGGGGLAYPAALLTQWAEAVISGPVRNIGRYDEAAKLLVTIAAPVQVALFALYDKVGDVLDTTRPWFLIAACSISVASVIGVIVYVVKVCDERLKLKIALPADCNQKDNGIISYLLDPAAGGPDPAEKTANAVRAWERHVEVVAGCKHKYLARAAWCFVAGTLMPLLLLIGLALMRWRAGGAQ